MGGYSLPDPEAGPYSGQPATFVDRAGAAASQQVTAPGQPLPLVRAIDASGDLFGTVTDANGSHVFVDRGGTVTSYDGSATSTATLFAGIDAAGDVFGTYVDGAGEHGFVEKNGAVSTVDADPNKQQTAIEAVNAGGDFAGTYGIASQELDPVFVSRARQVSLVTDGVPASGNDGGTYTSLNSLKVVGMNAAGTVAGVYQAYTSNFNTGRYANTTASFTVGADNTAKTLDVFESQIVTATGIDDAGDVFGTYRDAAGTTRSFADFASFSPTISNTSKPTTSTDESIATPFTGATVTDANAAGGGNTRPPAPPPTR